MKLQVCGGDGSVIQPEKVSQHKGRGGQRADPVSKLQWAQVYIMKNLHSRCHNIHVVQ